MKIKYVSKLYWNIYPYRVEIGYYFYNAKLNEVIDRQDCLVNHEDIFMKRNLYGMNFYFETAERLEQFVNDNGKLIDFIYKPYSDGAVSLMKSDVNLRVKAVLFYGKYRWKVNFKRMKNYDFHEIDEWIYKYFKDEMRNEKRLYYSVSSNRHLYCDREDDVFVVHLALNEKIENIEKVLLHEEIPNFSAAEKNELRSLGSPSKITDAVSSSPRVEGVNNSHG